MGLWTVAYSNKYKQLTLNVNLYNVILGTIRIAGSASVVTLVRLLYIPDRQLSVVVDNGVPADRHWALHLRPCQWWVRTVNTSSSTLCH